VDERLQRRHQLTAGVGTLIVMADDPDVMQVFAERALKHRYDPGNVFRDNFTIAPSPGPG